MIINANDGNTARSIRPFSDRAALAHFLDGIAVGEKKTITRFIGMKCDDVNLPIVQSRITVAKATHAQYRSYKTPDGGITVERLK